MDFNISIFLNSGAVIRGTALGNRANEIYPKIKLKPKKINWVSSSSFNVKI